MSGEKAGLPPKGPTLPDIDQRPGTGMIREFKAQAKALEKLERTSNPPSVKAGSSKEHSRLVQEMVDEMDQRDEEKEVTKEETKVEKRPISQGSMQERSSQKSEAISLSPAKDRPMSIKKVHSMTASRNPSSILSPSRKSSQAEDFQSESIGDGENGVSPVRTRTIRGQTMTTQTKEDE